MYNYFRSLYFQGLVERSEKLVKGPQSNTSLRAETWQMRSLPCNEFPCFIYSVTSLIQKSASLKGGYVPFEKLSTYPKLVSAKLAIYSPSIETNMVSTHVI